MIEFKLPSLGADMDEGKLLEWRVKPGDAVKRGDVVAIVDTAKAAVDVEIWCDGTVHELVTGPGETIPVGTVMATLFAPGEASEAARPYRREKPGEPPEVMESVAESPAASARPAADSSAGRRRVSPVARKRAEELGVALDDVIGTGSDGVVTLEDVEHVAAAKASADRHGEMRKAIAAAMSRSKREIPHYYLAEDIALRVASEWLQARNADRPVTGRLLMATLFLKAVALAVREVPEMNGFFRSDIVELAAAAHIGVAISLRQGGLIAPAIHDVGDKSLEQIMGALADLVQRARAGSLRSSEMSDPTITVTNLGDQGVGAVFGVIYPPQVALVGFGAPHLRPWVEDGVLRILPVVTASLAADHRVSDGHRGARFLSRIRELLQEPQQL